MHPLRLRSYPKSLKLLLLNCLAFGLLTAACAAWDAASFYSMGIPPAKIPSYLMQRWHGMFDRTFHRPG